MRSDISKINFKALKGGTDHSNTLKVLQNVVKRVFKMFMCYYELLIDLSSTKTTTME